MYPEGNRFALSTSEDQQAWLWISSILSLMYSMVILGTRLTVKWGYLALDDIVLTIAYVIAVAHWILLYQAITDGLGKEPARLTDQTISHIGELVFASRILFIISTSLTKYTTILFVRQIFTQANRKAWAICTATAAFALVWALAASLIASADCKPGLAVVADGDAYCSAAIIRYKFIAAIEFVFECAMIALPAYLFSAVQIKTQRKVTILLGFSFRLIDALLNLPYVLSYTAFLAGRRRTSIGLVETLVWQEALLASSLMSATVPVLKGFIGRFTTAELVRIDQSGSGLRSNQYTKSGRSGKDYGLGSAHQTGTEPDEIQLRDLGNGNQGTTTDIWHDGNAHIESESIGSGNSEQMIIRHRVEWEVTPGKA